MMRVLTSAVPILFAVAWLVGTAVWNRGAHVSRITLTERELPWTFPQDDRPARLWLDWERRTDPLDARNWLTTDRLRQIGFDLSMPPGAPGAERAYGRALPRRAWVVFEYDGDAWRTVERRRALSAETSPDSHTPSRLVPIDAGLDGRALAERYPEERHVILRAWIRLAWLGPDARGPLVYGYIRSLDPPSLTVPRPFAQRLRALSPSPARAREPRPGAAPSTPPIAPRYEVDLAVGRLGIPWIVDLR